MKTTGNFLRDLFGAEYSTEAIKDFANKLEQTKQIPFIHFADEGLEDELCVLDNTGNNLLVADIFNEINYPLNRGPFFYASNYEINYSHKTWIIFTQDGMILEEPGTDKIAFFSWDTWEQVLYTKHLKIDAPVILLAYPTEPDMPEISISPILDLSKNVKMWEEEDENGAHIMKNGYDDLTLSEMNFAFQVLKTFWGVVTKNRNSDNNSIPLEILNLLYKKDFGDFIKKEDEEELREGYSYDKLEELDDDDLTDLIYQYNVIDTSDDMPKDPKELLKDLWDNIDVDKIVPRRGVEYQQLTDLSNEDLIKMKAYLGLDTEKDLELMEHITEIWDWLYVVRNEDPIPYDYDRDSFLFDTYDDIHVGITYDNLKLLSHIEQWELGLAYYDGHDAFTPRLEDGKFKVEELWYFLKGYTNGDKLDYIPDLNCYLKDLVRCETEDDFKGWMEDAGMYGDEVTKYNIGTVWLAAREIAHEAQNKSRKWKELLYDAIEKRKEDAFSESNALLEKFIAWEDENDKIARAYQLMGENYLSLEAYDKVIEPLNKAIELGKEEYMVYSDLGRSYFALKNYDEAINAFKNASRLNDGAFYPDWMLARIFKEKDQNKEALEHINIAIERDKLSENSKAADYQLYNIRGDINIDLGNYQKAIEDFEQAVDLTPNSAFLNYRLGQLYYETKNYEAGYKNFQKAQSLDERMQSDGNILLLKGHCLYRLKKTAKALEEYDKASALGNEEAIKWKEFCLKKLKDS